MIRADIHVGPTEDGKQEGDIYAKLLQCLVPKTNWSALRDRDIKFQRTPTFPPSRPDCNTQCLTLSFTPGKLCSRKIKPAPFDRRVNGVWAAEWEPVDARVGRLEPATGAGRKPCQPSRI